MTAINCSAEQRALQGSWTQTELGLTGEMGPESRGMYTWPPLRPSRSVTCLTRPFLLPSSWARRAHDSDATSLGSQMEDPVPGTERVKHRLKPCFPSRNRWENNGTTGPKVSDKCFTRVAGPVWARASVLNFSFPPARSFVSQHQHRNCIGQAGCGMRLEVNIEIRGIESDAISRIFS